MLLLKKFQAKLLTTTTAAERETEREREMCGNLHKSGTRNLYSQGSCLFPSPSSVTLCGARYQRQLVSGFVGQYFQLMCFCATIQNLKHPLTHTHHTPIHTPKHTHVLPEYVCVLPLLCTI